MSIAFQEIEAGNVLEVELSGKLARQDYGQLAPAMDRLIRTHGKIRMLLLMRDFHGWTAGAVWEDTKLSLHHFGHIEKLAMVGETKWQKGMSVFCKPFTTAKIRYFDLEHLADARAWLDEH